MNLKGKRLSHNHVNNNPPSLEDMEVFIKQELKELRVVTTDGYLYIISNPNKKKLDFESIKKTYNQFYGDAVRKTKEKLKGSLIKRSEIKKEIAHIQWEPTIQKEGFQYERTKFRK